MEASKAREVIKSRKLINSYYSKFILKCLFGQSSPTEELFEFISREQFERAKNNIKKHHSSNHEDENQKAIRNLPILLEIKKKLPNFRWEVVKFKDKNKNVKHKLITNLDKVDGIQISLATALFYHKSLDLFATNKYFGPLKLESFDERLDQFQKLLTSINAITGDNFESKYLFSGFRED